MCYSYFSALEDKGQTLPAQSKGFLLGIYPTPAASLGGAAAAMFVGFGLGSLAIRCSDEERERERERR